MYCKFEADKNSNIHLQCTVPVNFLEFGGKVQVKPTLSEEGGSECLVEVLKREGCTISLMRSRRHHPTKGDMGSNESGREGRLMNKAAGVMGE